MEEYLEKFGQESGIWIYKENGAALIVNWSSVNCSGREPVVFYGGLVWFPPSDDEPGEWVKTGDNVALDGYITDNVDEIIYDANNDADFLGGMTGDVWETDNYLVLVPRGWN